MKNDFRHFPPYTALETFPHLLCSPERHAPLALLPHPSPITPPAHIPLDPTLVHYESPNCPFHGFWGTSMG